MGALATDDFNRANAANLGANWTKLTSFNNIGIASNKALGQSASDNVVAYSAVGFPNDQYSQVVLAVKNDDGGPTIRSDTTDTFYLFDTSGTGAKVYKCVGGTFTQLNSVGNTFANNDILYIEVQGTTIVTKVNGVTKNNFTDNAIASGKPGLHAFDTAIIYDNWEGGDFVLTETPAVSGDYAMFPKPTMQQPLTAGRTN